MITRARVCAARGRSRKLCRVAKAASGRAGGAPTAPHAQGITLPEITPQETTHLSKSNPRTRGAWRARVALLLAVTLLAAPALGRQSAAPAPAAALTDAERELLARVKAETIRELTTALSAKEMMGRGTGQPGGELAAQFIAE